MFHVYSTNYLEQEVEPYHCYVNEKIWKRVQNDEHTTKVFARIIKDDKGWICSLGPPILSVMNEDNNIFVPSWMLEQINCIGDGEELVVEWFPMEAFDHSTKIVLAPRDSIYQNENIQEQLSIELSKLGVLQKNTNVHIYIPEFDNYEVVFEVKELEPANIVLCEGNEVALDFDTTHIKDEIAKARPPSPYPHDLLPTVLHNTVEESIQPVQENKLGGVQRGERFNPWRNKDFKPSMS